MKLTKTELRDQQYRLGQLQKYLPTLQLKKAMLQIEVNEVSSELQQMAHQRSEAKVHVERFKSLFSDQRAYELIHALKVDKIGKHFENIAGIEVPFFDAIHFASQEYKLFDTPVWFDGAILGLQDLLKLEAELLIAMQRRQRLEKELREVSIRLNLFEKVLIPRAVENIKKIKVFLGDQQLSGVLQAKIAKRKIEKRNIERAAVEGNL